jgi:DNA-binding transcriptional ArsR family regulator
LLKPFDQEESVAVKIKQKVRKKKGPGERLAGVISHPLRVKVLGILNRRVASPNELSKELGENLSLVSHHVKVLREEGCIELVKQEPRRGAVEHYYRANVPAFFADEEWAKLSKEKREKISKTVLQALVCELFEALDTGSFDARLDRLLGWTPFPVDEEGWGQVVELLLEMLERTEQIRVAAAERLLAADEPGEQVVVAMMGFQRSGQ